MKCSKEIRKNNDSSRPCSINFNSCYLTTHSNIDIYLSNAGYKDWEGCQENGLSLPATDIKRNNLYVEIAFIF